MVYTGTGTTATITTTGTTWSNDIIIHGNLVSQLTEKHSKDISSLQDDIRLFMSEVKAMKEKIDELELRLSAQQEDDLTLIRGKVRQFKLA